MSGPFLPGSHVPGIRVREANGAPARPRGAYVLYWMTAARRLDHNFGLQRAVEWSRHLGRPLVILEALRVDYPWASDRLHRFALDGMAEHARRLEGARVTYHPYVEPKRDAGSGFLEALAGEAAVVVTDEYPAFFLPRMVEAAARKLPVRLEAVDSCGLLPLRAAGRAYGTARAFRRFLQEELPGHLLEAPAPHPLAGDPLPRPASLPEAVASRWPGAGPELLSGREGLSDLPVDHDVEPVSYRGGTREAVGRLERFLEEDLERYPHERNDPDADVSSGLSPWLHWGHVSSHRVFRALAEREGWSPARLGAGADGRREGWWGMSPAAEAFLDELVTWRELGFNGCAFLEGYDRYESLPEWARKTLEAHRNDPRPRLYGYEELRAARTHDELWNAAQRQLRGEGRIHGYLRMLWGKRILAWTPGPRRALEIMLDLNNRYAVDGRDPNSYSGIFWILGRYDRGWPEREVFGKVRCMTSASTRRKHSVGAYLERFGPA